MRTLVGCKPLGREVSRLLGNLLAGLARQLALPADRIHEGIQFVLGRRCRNALTVKVSTFDVCATANVTCKARATMVGKGVSRGIFFFNCAV